MLQPELADLIKNNQNLVLLETIKQDEENTKSLLFVNPIEIISASNLGELPSMFEKIENALRQGYYLAGYLSYECGFHFMEIPFAGRTDEPVAWFGIYEQPRTIEPGGSSARGRQVHSRPNVNREHGSPPVNNSQFIIHHSQFIINNNEEATLKSYSEKISNIKNYIREGDVYQINFTGRMKFNFDGEELALYDSLKNKQRVSYSSFIRTENQTILSLSPELFFRREGNRMIVRPMKGTVKRGRTTKEDAELISWLRNDKKSQAENVMIVDVLRNDLGKISEIGSVKTSSLFDVEKYESLFQMTSTVEMKLLDGVSYYELFKAMFPCGSVTGAPKRRAMEIISELEETPRGIYTGAIGYISPKKEAVFNVAIRTVVLDPSPLRDRRPSLPLQGRECTMGTGGGIVWDSDAESEFKECLLKADFLTVPVEEFQLIETILWRDGFQFLDKHLKRLKDSCEYFDFRYDEERNATTIHNSRFTIHNKTNYKVRLLLSRSGEIEIESTIIHDEVSNKNIIAVSSARTNSSNRFLYHKTTRRKLYDEMFRQANERGLADVIFLNEHDEITEGCISNVFIKKGDYYFTPPVECGLLNGVYRQHLLETLPNVEERILFLEDLKQADFIYLSNAIRGLREVHLKVI